MGRSPCCAKRGVIRGAWSEDEDQILTNYVSLHGEGKWRKVAQEAGLNRCFKSCRLRWVNYLKPGIKRGAITPDEEDLIIRLHRLLGNRWALIAARLPGRTDNEIKNYWNTNLVKKFRAARPDNKHHLNYEEKNGTFASNQLVLNQQVNSHDKVLASTEFSASNEQDKDLVNMISNSAKNSDAKNLIPFRAMDGDDNDMNFLNAGDEDFVVGVPESNLPSHDETTEMGEQNDLTQTANNDDSCDQPTLSKELKKLALFLELED